ncbi:MAG: methyltransferase domain-containing protein [Nitriliruptorales bacterium]
MNRGATPRFDPFLRRYLSSVKAVLEPLRDRDVLDVAAGTQWVRHVGFRSYAALDIVPPSEHWDLNDPLPERHVRRYDLVVCLGALHYTLDPPRSLDQALRAATPGADVVLMVPWLYPPHDRRADRWRLSPRLAHGLLAERFESVELRLCGTVLELGPHLVKRVIEGPFRGVDAATLARLQDPVPPVSATTTDDVPLSWWRPLNVLAHARGFMGAGS